MALFKVNTGCREHEVCTLKWEWEIKIPELNTSVFLIPAENVKNRQERLVVLNKVAQSVIEEMRGIHSRYVFTYKGHAILKMNGHAWRKARLRANLRLARVHDLKHTFGRRLRAAGVSFEDRQDLLGHKSGRITTHYSAAELTNLIDAAEEYLARRIDEIRQAVVFGIRPKRTFRKAATKYLNEATKTTIAEDAMHLKMLDPYIGDLCLDKVHIEIAATIHR